MRYTLLEGLLFSTLIVTASTAAAQTVQDATATELTIRPPVQEAPLIVETPVAEPLVIEETPPPTNRRSANTTEIQCLARNIYWEARGEGQRGMRAVAHVTMNRVKSGLFRRTVCGTVYQGGQFSWTTHRRSPSGNLWQTSQNIAEAVYTKEDVTDPTHGATYFHARGARPGWANRFTRTITIGAHYFYRA